jgi:hypothetical protein
MTPVRTIGTKGSRVLIKGCLRDLCHDRHVLKVPHPSTNFYGDKRDFNLQYHNKRPLLHQINAVIKHAILSFEIHRLLLLLCQLMNILNTNIHLNIFIQQN